MDEARAFLAGIRAEFPDATHHVPAFMIGGGRSSTEFCSDDGEPGGTAGRPLLAVLRGAGLGNVAIVVVRYFGGTLLGTGGLVKAYSEAGREVLALAGRARLETLELVEVALPYPIFDAFKRLADASGAGILSTEFAESVRARVELPAEGMEKFLSDLADLSGGALSPLRLGTRRCRVTSQAPGSPVRGR